MSRAGWGGDPARPDAAAAAGHLVVLGAGALGTLFGARAALAGLRVTLVGRGNHLAALRRHGVEIRDATGSVRSVDAADLSATDDVRSIAGRVDYLIVAVKQADTSAALDAARVLRGRVGCAFSLQNGLPRDDRLIESLGQDPVIGATTMEGAALPEPGVVTHLLASTTWVGELDGTPSARIADLAGWLRRAGFATTIAEDITAARWTKFVQSCAASGVCGVTRQGYAPATVTEPGARLYVALVLEGAAVMAAAGLRPVSLSPEATRVRDIADLPVEDGVRLVRALARRLIASGYTGGTSLLRDLEQGRTTEVDSLLGDLCDRAAESGVSVPVSRAVYWAIKAAERAGRGQSAIAADPPQD